MLEDLIIEIPYPDTTTLSKKEKLVIDYIEESCMYITFDIKNFNIDFETNSRYSMFTLNSKYNNFICGFFIFNILLGQYIILDFIFYCFLRIFKKTKSFNILQKFLINQDKKHTKKCDKIFQKILLNIYNFNVKPFEE